MCIPTIDLSLLENFVKEIATKLREEKIYPEEILIATFSVKPREEFVTFVREIFGRFCRKRKQEALLATFYQEIYNKWKSFRQKTVNLALVHFPQKLIGYYKQATTDTGDKVSNIKL